MEVNNAYHPKMSGASAKVDYPEGGVNTAKNAEQKIRARADIVGVFGSIGALILGLVVWKRQGVVVGLLYAGFFVFVSCTFDSLLNSYADAISLTLNRTKIPQKLAAESHDEPPVFENTEENLKSESEPETADGVTAHPEPEAADSIAPGSEPEDPIDPGYETAGEKTMAGALPEDLEKANPDMPSDAYACDKTRRIAHFQKRSRYGVICPVCGKRQSSDKDACFHCSCRFLFDDEKQSRKSRTV